VRPDAVSNPQNFAAGLQLSPCIAERNDPRRISVDVLHHLSDWYLHGDALKGANRDDEDASPSPHTAEVASWWW
jgi:hypothetical protein